MAANAVLEQPEQMVVFRLNSESYCIDIFQVHEIIRMREITPAPGTAPHIKGLINLRGKTIPVVDLSMQLGFEGSELGNDTRIIVVEGGHGNVGLVVDAVQEVVTLQPSAVDATPPLVETDVLDLVRGVAKHEMGIITLLNLDQII
jgi:purine-binding chemotaxis protein CheW